MLNQQKNTWKVYQNAIYNKDGQTKAIERN